ncbi:hypothetical protein ACQZ46_02370 [Agrobacterium salinitolerans]
MVTDEMVEKAIDKAVASLIDEHPMGHWRGDQVKEVARRAIAALSAAGPVSSRNDEAGYVEFLNQDVPYIVRDIQGAVAILTDLETRNVIGYRVYDPDSAFARQTAPSVAVKEGQMINNMLLSQVLQNAFFAGRGTSGIVSPEDMAAWQDYDPYNLEAYKRIRSALSAQVKDVAGWQDEEKLTPKQAWTILCETPDITSPEEYPDHALITFEQLQSYMERAHNPVAWQDISTAPRDGTKILMRGGAYHGVPFPGYWNPSSFAPDRPWVSVVNDSRLYEHVPTHWMPLPAAPAKQEGGANE